MIYLWVMLGSALGGVGRFWVSVVAARWLGDGFPWGTIAINVTGSFVIGFFGALTVPGGRFPMGFDVRTFVMVGICGGYTTFSSFSLQTLTLAQNGAFLWAGANVVMSVCLCLFAVWLGYAAAGLGR